MKSFKHSLSHYVISRFSLAAVSVMLQCFLFYDAAAQDYGNTTAQEYGDAVYVYLNVFLVFDYNHTAIYSGLDSSGNGRVLQAYGTGYNTGDYSFSDYCLRDVCNG